MKLKMEIQEKILTHLSAYGKENKYRLARALKIDVSEVTEALDVLEREGKIEIKEGNAMLVKVVEVEKQPKEVSEELTEEVIEEELPEDISEEEKIEGTVKFYNPNKRFGYITGDDGKDYRVHESGLKEGVTIEANDRVSFKVIISYKGPEAVEVEKISESVGVQYA